MKNYSAVHAGINSAHKAHSFNHCDRPFPRARTRGVRRPCGLLLDVSDKLIGTQMNKFRFSCFVLAFGGMIFGLILPGNISRLVGAEEMDVTATQANKDAFAVEPIGAQ